MVGSTPADAEIAGVMVVLHEGGTDTANDPYCATGGATFSGDPAIFGVPIPATGARVFARQTLPTIESFSCVVCHYKEQVSQTQFPLIGILGTGMLVGGCLVLLAYGLSQRRESGTVLRIN